MLNYNPDLNDHSRHENNHVQVSANSSESSLRVAFPLSSQGRGYESEDFCVKFLKLFPVRGMLSAYIF